MFSTTSDNVLWSNLILIRGMVPARRKREYLAEKGKGISVSFLSERKEKGIEFVYGRARVDGHEVDCTSQSQPRLASTARTLATKLYRHHDRSKWPRSAAVRRSDNDLRDSASSVC